MSGFKSLKPKSASGGYKDEIRLDAILDILKYPEKEFCEVRFMPNTEIMPLKQHWVKILGGKDKREIKVSRWCIAFDPKNEGVPLEGVKCPYCDLSTGDTGSQQIALKYYANVIVRDLQQSAPRSQPKPTKEEKQTGFTTKGSKTWTPVRVLAMTPTLVTQIQDLEERNIHKVKGVKTEFPITHKKYGIDIAIKFDNDKAGSDKYRADRGERTPLTEEEMEYLVYNISPDLLTLLNVKTQEEADADFKKMDIIGMEEIDDEDDDDDDDDDDDSLSSKKKKKKPAKKKASKFDPDDDDDEPIDEDDEDDEDDDEDDDEPVKKKKKSSTKSSNVKKKKSSKFDDDDDDDEPVKKKKKKSSKFDDEDDEPVKKKKKKASKFDDEDDEPVKKKKKKSSKVDDDDDEPVKKKKKVKK